MRWRHQSFSHTRSCKQPPPGSLTCTSGRNTGSDGPFLSKAGSRGSACTGLTLLMLLTCILGHIRLSSPFSNAG